MREYFLAPPGLACVTQSQAIAMKASRIAGRRKEDYL